MAKEIKPLMRIDNSLRKQIEEFAKKNDLSLVAASKELARLNNINLRNKKILKEIKF